MTVRKGLSGVEQKLTEKFTYRPGGEKKNHSKFILQQTASVSKNYRGFLRRSYSQGIIKLNK